MKVNIKFTIQTLSLGVLLFLGTSCSDFLDEVDPSNITADSYYKTPDHARTAVNAIYANLRTIRGGAYGGSPWLMVEFATGLADSDLGQADNSNIIRNLNNNSDNAYGLVHWSSNYEGIADANLAISKIPEIQMPEALKNSLLGEAKFLRAHFYYQLVRLFGSVPLILEPIDLASEDLYATEASEEEIYEQIVKDLTDAEGSGLPFNGSSGRVTLGAIKTLLSSVYLTMAGYPLEKGASYYTLAAEKSKEVIDSGEFSLFSSYDDLHDPSKKNIGENIFMVQYTTLTAPSDWQPLIIPYNMNISTYSAQTGAIYANQDFIHSYETGDERVKEKAFYYTTYTLKTDRTQTVNLGGYFLYKHFDIEANLVSASSDLNWSLHRYAELLLIYAEASNEVNGPNPLAYEGVNAIRNRAGLSPLSGLSKEEFREAVWREKWHELSYEGITWFDMVRTRKGYDVLSGAFEDFVGHQFAYGPTLTARELLFPIPTSEIRNNSNLVQNPGY
ncbi:RagB/SusD family nutrient uptake outer membrane protein [Echinicola strongylocentroti]|uniref:RagB/SusD family nutrient uptake outer membrane protein n=1 Tax=Echinicola strongylocentroti TaxID=1795355 RepID=A0A2Z4IRG9_9BACT|nr:RagB/SusD family nutrient uptake outer membrane protein [Echinicola strongylocentroti]AWW33309.1 RagB/SusD family nutrient uptake outer membrane protein [Echinicola strongylocentroti]